MPTFSATRVLDLAALAASAPLWVPLVGVLAAINRVLNGPPVLFSQERAGLEGKPFSLLKFRTMINDADAYLDEDGHPTRDRITGFGKVMRRSSLDELPQLFNVLRGEMSLVGPRPVLPSWVEKFPRKEAHPRFSVRPGLTGLAQIAGRNTVPWTRRLALDAQWAEQPSTLNYVKIIVSTPAALLRPTVSNDRNAAAVDDLPKAQMVN